jgi:hypothetical protein
VWTASTSSQLPGSGDVIAGALVFAAARGELSYRLLAKTPAAALVATAGASVSSR